MIRKSITIIIVLLFYAGSLILISAHESPEIFSSKLRKVVLLPPVELLKIVSCDFSSIISEVFYAYGEVILGNYDEKTATPDDWKYAFRTLTISRDLDPYFKDPYRLVQGIFPWLANMSLETIEFLKKGMEFRTWDPYIPYYIGFDYYFFLSDYKNASKYLFKSAKIGKNPFMATLASKIAYKGGDVRTGIAFLGGIYKSTKNEKIRKTIKMRIDALVGVAILQKAIAEYEKKYGEKPSNLNLLVKKGILRNLPRNPYKVPYRLENGQIKFD